LQVKRRSLLKALAVGGGAAFAAPAISKGLMEWRMVTSWPKGLPGLGTGAERLAANITAMSGGRLTIKVYAAGELVPALECFGAVGAMLLAVVKRRFSVALLREVMRTTLSITSMIFVILLGASVFSLVFRGLGGENLVHDALASMPGGVASAVLAVMLVIFVLGFFLDTFEIIFIVVPIAAPVLIKLGADPIWLGVMIGMNLQASFLTPPFGFALFYLRGVTPAAVPTAAIYRGVVPFVVLQLLLLGLLLIWPSLATWLPERLYG